MTHVIRFPTAEQQNQHLNVFYVLNPFASWQANSVLVLRLFWKGHQDASRTLEKMCWLRRGERWRLTCASNCLTIMVKEISPGHIWTTLYTAIPACFPWFYKSLEVLKCVSITCCNPTWISSVVSKRRPFSRNFILGNRKKSQGARSGE